ncbi:phosphotriesterase family protein [Mycolicibacterium moriokaense]|uniref:Phosphotriesterase-related protein n=1 Tax=Mycolicibacterium moriokaense TaxID=39691 RepID=A0A318H071_9MYCO|nr:phosphotriesterase [Mycolicibacterium moriokaense]PXW95924.1 phosphotriesterase-related protein [Mycolicibacterium moriokaense]
MAIVESVRGGVEAGDLGRVLMHEHIFLFTPEIHGVYDTGWREEVGVAEAKERLKDLSACGISTIVDLTVIGHGRHIPRIQRVNAEVDINIIVATGLYTFDDLPRYINFRALGRARDQCDVLTEMFVKDIEIGIAETGVKAGMLKCATDEPGVTNGVERVLRAVAQAHQATGVPISTHTHAPTRRGLEQQDVFEQEGVDLRQVVIGHCGDTTDLGYLKELMARGSYIGMDRFGLDVVLAFEERVNTVAALCDRGYADQMVLSHDANCFNDWFPAGVMSAAAPNWSYVHITRDVVPALRQRGVTDAQINQMLIDNPRAILGREHRQLTTLRGGVGPLVPSRRPVLPIGTFSPAAPKK